MAIRAFRLQYNKLNHEQRLAVNSVDGPVFVVAGPGTGKTTVLTLRIANILRNTDTSPENILALTFTESGVYSMRKSLVNVIGGMAYRVRISTFHSFCNEIIQNFPEYFSDIIGSRHIGRIEQIQILEKIIKEGRFSIIRPHGNIFYYVYPLLQKISELKKDAVHPKELLQIIRNIGNSLPKAAEARHTKGVHKGKLRGEFIRKTKNLAKAKELLSVYKKYQEELKRGHLYDYDDMIMEVVSVLSREEDLVLLIGEQYQYILADEHQDVNRSQNKVLELLSRYHAPYPNLFIVGDEKQAIFRFQGASSENMHYFQKLFPRAAVISLLTNYRSPQNILDSAHSLITKSSVHKKEKSKPLKGVGAGSVRHVLLYPFSTTYHEETFVADEIERLIAKESVPPSDICVLYRDNKDAHPYARALEKKNIPFSIESDQDIFSDPDIGKLMMLLRAIHNFGDSQHLISVLHINFFGVPPLDIYTLTEEARKKRISLYKLIKDKEILKKISIESPSAISDIYLKLNKWKKNSTSSPFSTFLEEVVNESGYLRHILSDSLAPQKLGHLEALFEEVKHITQGRNGFYLEDFITYIDLLERYNLPVATHGTAVLLDSVHLMTAHRAKGLEFPYIFIVGAQDRHWGGRRSRTLFPITYLTTTQDEEDDDERRLFYVALTRARKKVYITYAKEDSLGKERMPTRFVEEINKKFIEEIKTSAIEKIINNKREGQFVSSTPTQVPQLEKEYLNKLFLDRGLSVTALNNYISCPWRYFYTNLLRVPSIQSPPQIYGEAIHEALKKLFDIERKGEKSNVNEFILIFENSLNKHALHEGLYVEYLARGKEALRGYHKKYKNLWSKDVLTEFSIRGVYLSKEIKLHGKLDKIEILPNGNGVNVVDYKTGHVHGRRAIEGLTKSSSGNYKRQLVFYKLLLNLLNKKGLNMISGEIDFVEPDKNKQYKKEKFTISRGEVEELEKIIKKVAQEIIDLSFWDKKCSDKKCKYCILRQALK